MCGFLAYTELRVKMPAPDINPKPESEEAQVKFALPAELVTGSCVLGVYCAYLRAFQAPEISGRYRDFGVENFEGLGHDKHVSPQGFFSS